jgi:NADH:ubiquinone oxidoreductase subunit 3 (subunit A)
MMLGEKSQAKITRLSPTKITYYEYVLLFMTFD